MTVISTLRASACAAALATLPALASANEAAAIVDGFLEMLEEYDAEVSVESRSLDGNSARYEGVTINGGDGEALIEIPFIAAAPRAGGIGIDYAREIKLRFGFGEIELTLNSSNPDYVISGDAGARRHTWSDDLVTLVGGGADDVVSMNMRMEEVAGVFLGDDGDVPRITGDSFASAMQVAYTIAPGGNELEQSVDYRSDDVRITYTFDLVDEDEMMGYLSGERMFSVSMEGGASETRSNILTETGPIGIVSGSDTSRINVSMANRVVDYEVEARGMEADITPPPGAFPPVSVDMAGLLMDIGMSFGDKGDVTPAEVIMSLEDLAVSDSLWSIVDPGGQLPREPVNLTLDLAATLEWLISAGEDLAGEAQPVQPRDVELRQFLLSAAGASIAGSGKGEIQMRGPVPQPVGTLRVDMLGVMTLLDKLVALGLVPQQQAAMARMMAPSFTVKGTDSDDHLITDVESRADGALIVNGNRIR